MLFGRSAESLDECHLFGVDLTASHRSDFAQNELDVLLDDVQEMRRATGASVGSDIRNVGEFCALAVDCSRVAPDTFTRIAHRWSKECAMRMVPRWRRSLFWLFGV